MARKKATTPEEAFLAAIEASPQDMLPRLVYADWLDERNDPRGEYLRLEVERHRVEMAGTTLDQSALARLGELEDTLAVEWFYKVAVRDYPNDESFTFSRFWRALAGYEGSHRRMSEHLERIPEDQLRFWVEQFQVAICYVNACSWEECWPHKRRGWSEDAGDDLAAWVVMQGKVFYDQVRSRPEQVEQLGDQHEAAEQELRRRWNANRRRKPGPIREAEEDRIQFQQSRLDWVAREIYHNRHGRDLPLFGG